MALKMPKARLVRPPPAATLLVDAGTYDKIDRPGTLLCMDVRCNAELRHVPHHPENRRKVQAYFGRKPNAVHTHNCRFDVEATVTRIVAGSARFEEKRNPIVLGSDGKAVFRLNIVLDDIRSLAALEDGVGANPEAREAAEYVAGVRALSPYLRRARAVLALIARVEDREELGAALRISYNDRVLAWRDFLYGPDDLGRLYRHLQSLEGAGEAPHPVAVVVEPQRVLSSNLREVVLQCSHDAISVRSGGEVRVAPKLACRPPTLARPLMTGRSYLVCGLPRPSKGALHLRPGPEDLAYANVYMTVGSRNQLALWPH